MEAEFDAVSDAPHSNKRRLDTLDQDCSVPSKVPLKDASNYLTIGLPNGTKKTLKIKSSIEFIKHLQHAKTNRIYGDLFEGYYTEAEVLLKKSGAMGVENRRMGSHVRESLLVDQFKPKGYVDLLSDEVINRLILKWLKLWDHVVFGKDKNSISKLLDHSKPDEKEKSFRPLSSIELSLSHAGVPQPPVLLLSGLPGAGKTTLAHILAEHCGYDSIEMNASDDRSIEAFRNILETCCGTSVTMGAGNKPHCLILDEIDGAPGSSVNVLIDMIKYGVPKKRRGKGNSKIPLLRPVICICNNPFAASLRNLKPHVLHIQVPSMNLNTLANRMSSICESRGVFSEKEALFSIGEICEGDVRACLNALQMLLPRVLERSVESGIKTLTLADVTQAANSGGGCFGKDSGISLFNVLKMVFFIDRLEKQKANQEVAGKNRDRVRLERLFHALNRSDVDKIVQGIHEHFIPVAELHHVDIPSVYMACDYLSFHDHLSLHINKRQAYSLFPYKNIVPVLFHLLMCGPASSQGHRFSWPKTDFEVSQGIAKSKEIVASLLVGMSMELRANVFSNATSIVNDLAPNVLALLQPKVRPINQSLLSSSELSAIDRVAAIMSSLGLVFTQQCLSDTQSVFVLQPPIHDLSSFRETFPLPWLGSSINPAATSSTKFGLATPDALPRLSHVVRIQISRLLNISRMASSLADVSLSTGGDAKTPAPIVKSNTTDKTSIGKGGLASFFQSSKPVKAANTPLLPRNASGQLLHRKDQKDSTHYFSDNPSAGPKSVVWFNFKEGYSNAVKKPVKISRFL